MALDFLKEVRALIAENREEYTNLLKKLVSFDSVMIRNGQDGNEKEIQIFLTDLLKRMGAEVDSFEPDNARISQYDCYNANHQYKDRPNVVGVFKGSGEGKSVVMNGHADVVSPGEEERWTSPPYKPEIRDGRMYGRGTCDMKAGLAAAICAVKLLKEQGYSFQGDVILEAVIDEEGGGNGTLACCDRGYKADAAVLMEPTSLKVMPANRGTFLASFTVQGKPIHASMRGFGVNAIEKAMKIFAGLRELEEEWLLTMEHPILGNPTINLGQIYGGEGASVVAGECTVKFDVEFFPNVYDKAGNAVPVDPKEVQKIVQERVNLICAGDAWLRDHVPQIDWYQTTLCFETPENDPFLVSAVQSVKESMGYAAVKGLPCGCDGYQLNVVGGMPTVVFGPGDIINAHGYDEYVEMEEYFRAIEVYVCILKNWVGLKKES